MSPQRVLGPGVQSEPGTGHTIERRKARAARLALAGIILASSALAARRVFLVPIFQGPDEPAHLNYALNIYSAGRPYSAHEPCRRWNTAGGRDPMGLYRYLGFQNLHVYTSYLVAATDFEDVIFKYEGKVKSDYGTSQYYQQLDAGAPAEDSGELDGQPRERFGLLTIYPFGYYALLAGWMKLATLFSSRLTTIFFAARLFSVALLMVNLLLMYANAREIHLSRARSLAMVALVGFFPMTTFVSSSIQPDNFTLTMVLLSCFLALLVRRRPERRWLLACLGIALGVLCVTKYHVYAAILAALIAMLVADRLAGKRWYGGWGSTLALLLGPSLVLACVQAWVLWGSHTVLILSDPTLNRDGASLAASQGAASLARYLVEGVGKAFANFYWSGSTFQTFWGRFGWMDQPLIIMTPWKTEMIQHLIRLVNVTVFSLALLRLGQVVRRLLVLAKRGAWRRPLSVALANPLISGYLIFTVMMFCLFAICRTSYVPQGRNWFPFIFPIFLMAAQYAPRAVGVRWATRMLSVLLIAGLALYCLAGSYYSASSIYKRYYVDSPVPVLLLGPWD